MGEGTKNRYGEKAKRSQWTLSALQEKHSMHKKILESLYLIRYTSYHIRKRRRDKHSVLRAVCEYSTYVSHGLLFHGAIFNQLLERLLRKYCFLNNKYMKFSDFSAKDSQA